MALDWEDIEQAEGFAGLRAHAEAEVLPLLNDADLRPMDGKKPSRRISGVLTGRFIFFVVFFVIIQGLLPNTWWGETLTFILFPVLFFISFIGALFLFRRTLMSVLLDAKRRFLIRGKALAVLCAPLGLTYVPTPGGSPGSAGRACLPSRSASRST